jgi:hypothetical protein
VTSLRTALASPSALTGLIATAVVAYAIHSSSWIAHQIDGGTAWPRWLELLYLATFVVWVAAFVLALVAKSQLRRTTPRPIVDDERTAAVFMRAHQAALVVVVLAQVPFFFITVPAHVLAQLTVTTSVVVLFATYAWMDR